MFERIKIIRQLKKLKKRSLDNPRGDGFFMSLRRELENRLKSNPVREKQDERLGISEAPVLTLNNIINKFKLMNMKTKTAIMIGLVVALAGGGTALASQGSLPGETLFPVKLFTEEARLALKLGPDSKIKFRAKLAGERLEEIKILVETKGVDAKGLEIALARLEENINRINEMLSQKADQGQDISSLKEEVNNVIGSDKSGLSVTVKEQRDELKTIDKELKEQRDAAKKEGNDALAQDLENQRRQVKNQRELLEDKEEEIEHKVELEIEVENEDNNAADAKEAIDNTKREKQKLINEAKEENVSLLNDVFSESDQLLAEAENMFEEGDFRNSKLKAKETRKALDRVDDLIDELEDANEDDDNGEDNDDDENEDENENENEDEKEDEKD